MKKQLLILLLACGLTNAQVFSENFNAGTLPSGWTVSNSNPNFNWGIGSQNTFAIFPSGAAFFDDNGAGPSGNNTNPTLVSPIINISATASPMLSFKYANHIYSLNSTLKAEVFNGTTWVEVFSSAGESGTWGIDFNTFKYIVNAYAQANINLAPYANANFQLRFVYNDVGDYSYGVAVDDVTITTSTTLSTSDVSNLKELNVYPNPVKDNLYIKSDLKSNSKVSVVDMSGKLVKTFNGKSDSYNVSDLPKGTYMILIENNQETIKKKIIKQ